MYINLYFDPDGQIERTILMREQILKIYLRPLYPVNDANSYHKKGTEIEIDSRLTNGACRGV